MKTKSTISIILYVFIPFMVAYLLSELYRNVNGFVGPVVREEFNLSAEYLGLMTSVFLMAVAGAQVFACWHTGRVCHAIQRRRGLNYGAPARGEPAPKRRIKPRWV